MSYLHDVQQKKKAHKHGRVCPSVTLQFQNRWRVLMKSDVHVMPLKANPNS
jgi:hypothetical protein